MHTACMGLSLSMGITPFLSSFVIPFFCSTRAASILPPRPHISIAVARSGGQGRRFSRHFCLPLSFHSFVRPAPRAFFRPDRIFPLPSRAAAVKDGASHAIFVFLCHSILLFDPRREHSSAPTAYFHCRRAQRRSRTALLQRRRRLVLDGREHGGRLRRSGGWPCDDPRGACHWPRSIARTTLVFGWTLWGPDHEAVIRFCGQGSEAAGPFS